MKEATKMFNLLLPFRQYQALRERGVKKNVSIAEQIRQGVDYILTSTKSEQPTGLIKE